jgi:membrane-bound metal-dependent hydrolase YbcI (DUF457 family)
MPSPVGHAIAGIAAGWIVAGARRAPLQTAALAVAATAPDLDLLVGAHSGPTHGLGAAVIAGVLAWIAARYIRALRPATAGATARFVLAIALAYASHTLLDWLSTDTSPPIGIMALWPVSREYYESSLHLFFAISRRYWRPDFWALNMRALARELIVLLPVLAIVWLARVRGARL